jgi:two-component system, response regulator, stage 0 sporulation protein F
MEKCMVKKILVVEDEEILNRIYAAELREEGYDAVTAFDGRTALGIIESEKLDLVILDIKLPDMNGLQVLKSLRVSQPLLPVIVCSAYDHAKTDFAELKTENTEYLVKPIKLEMLRDKIRSLVG